MGIDEILGSKRDEILRIAARHGVTSIRVFGSVARGEAGPESDVDFLVEIGDRVSPWFPAGLILDLEDLLGREVDVATTNGLHWYLKDRILAEAVGF
jgi:hypothetical protein